MKLPLSSLKKNPVRTISHPEDASFQVNIPRAVSEFENAMQKFPIKKVLYKSLFRGKGLEFDSFREFGSGEDASLVDWKASLRANTLLARSYIEERNIEVYFVVDASNSMLFGSGKRLKAEYTSELVASLAHLILSSGDKIGLVMCSDHVVKFLPPSSSRNQFHLFSKFLTDTHLYGGGFNLNHSVDFLLRHGLHKEAVFIIVSDFVQTHSSVKKRLKLLGHRYETMAIMVRDPLDEAMPKISYQFAIQDPYSGKQMVIDPALASEKYRENVLIRKQFFKSILNESRIDVMEVLTDKPFVYPVMTFLKSRSERGIRR